MLGTWLARFTLLACLIGIAVPVYCAGWPAFKLNDVLIWAFFTLPTAMTFAMFGITAWGFQRSAGASIALLAVTTLAALLGWWKWSDALEDPKGIELLFTAVIIPPIQFALWGAVSGAAMAHLRNCESSVITNPPEAGPSP
jgi:hypothetical protein